MQSVFHFGYEVDGMSLMWFLKRLVGPKGGLFAYLTSRDQNKSRIELEKARQAAATDLIDHLPDRAVFRERTAAGWRDLDAATPRSYAVRHPCGQQRARPRYCHAR